MTMSPMHQAKQPVTFAAGPYGHPFHPILVTVPIGAWMSSVVFDLGSHAVDDGSYLVRGAAWLVVIGVLGAVVAALFGLLDLLAIPRGTRAFRTGIAHMSLNLTAVALFAVDFLLRRGDLDRTATPAGPLLLSIAGVAILGASGWLGGMLAYHFGVRVADEEHQAEGFVRTGGQRSE